MTSDVRAMTSSITQAQGYKVRHLPTNRTCVVRGDCFTLFRTIVQQGSPIITHLSKYNKVQTKINKSKIPTLWHLEILNLGHFIILLPSTGGWWTENENVKLCKMIYDLNMNHMLGLSDRTSCVQDSKLFIVLFFLKVTVPDRCECAMRIIHTHHIPRIYFKQWSQINNF